MSNTEYKPKKYEGYAWFLKKADGSETEVITPHIKATAEIKHLLNEGYRILRLTPIY